MRICHITSSYPRFDQEGNARFVRAIAEAQTTLGHEVHVLAPYTPEVQAYSSPVQLHWVRYILPARLGVMGHAGALENDKHLRGSVLWQAPLFAASLAIRMQMVVLQKRIDLIHAHWAIPSGFMASWIARANRKPLFVSLHGSDMYLARENALFREMAKWALQGANGITACSQPLAETAIGIGACAERLHILPYGADLMELTPEIFANRWRIQLGLPVESCIILAVGRLVAKKGFTQLVRAMPLVLKQVPGARLIILGEGFERAALEHLGAELRVQDRVFLPGAVSWTLVAKYLAAADVLVMPSVQDEKGNLDGLPNVILEAMAAGRPVIATRIAGIPLAVQDKVTGVLVDEADPELLSAALINLLTSPAKREAMGRAARARIETELNWIQFARRLDQIYDTDWEKRRDA